MKHLDLKSMIIGVVGTTTLLILTSGITNPSENIQFIPFAAGTGIYNHQTNTLYLYKAWNANLGETPSQILKVSEDGSELTKIK